MTSPYFVTDIDGAKVRLGDTVKVLAIDASIKLEKNEVEKVTSMVGEEFEVDEIDEHGCAWVTKWWHTTESESEAHGISLTSQQMKLVRSKKWRLTRRSCRRRGQRAKFPVVSVASAAQHCVRHKTIEMTGTLENLRCPKCGASLGAERLARHLRFGARRPVVCESCGEEVTKDSAVFRALVTELPKHRKRLKALKKKKLFNRIPSTMAKALKADRDSKGKKSKSIRTTSGGAFESNRRRH